MKKWLKPQRDFSLKVNSDFFCSLIDETKNIWIAFEGSIQEIDQLLMELKPYLTSSCQLKFISKENLIEMVKKALHPYQKVDVKYLLRNFPFEVQYFLDSGKFRLSVEQKIEAPAIKRSTKIKVLLVDDSKTILTLLSTMLKSDASIEVIGQLTNPLDVPKFIAENKPDVITLDIHMPEMNGVELLKLIRKQTPIPTMMITSLNINEGGLVLDALEHGAFDYFQKPKMEEISSLTPVLIEKIKAAAISQNNASSLRHKLINDISFKFHGNLNQQLIALGASTGGTNALADLLKTFPKDVPPIIIVQHIPPVFSAAFAKRLNEICSFEVKESEEGDVLRPGLAIVARGGVQLKIITKGDQLVVSHTDDPPLNRFKPSVDYMFNSLTNLNHKNIAAALLTGMGNDGAKGMLALRKQGVETIAQDEKTCVVFGMPREAIEAGGASYVEPLNNIGVKLSAILNQPRKAKAS